MQGDRVCAAGQEAGGLETAEEVARNAVLWDSQRMFFEGSLPLSVNDIFIFGHNILNLF